MTETKPALPAETGHRDHPFQCSASRRAVRLHRVALRGADEYQALVVSLVAEHAPQGTLEAHLVEELAGILWRKRRLRLAEGAAYRRGLAQTLGPFRRTAKAALVHLQAEVPEEGVAGAIHASAVDGEEEKSELEQDEAAIRRALELLNSRRNDAYEAAMAALREDTQERWADTLARNPEELEEDEEPFTPDTEGLRRFLELRARCCPGSRRARRNWPTGRSSASRRSVSRSIPRSWSGSAATKCTSTASSNGCSLYSCASRTCGGGRSPADPFRKTMAVATCQSREDFSRPCGARGSRTGCCSPLRRNLPIHFQLH
jgi:hypothetical protein